MHSCNFFQKMLNSNVFIEKGGNTTHKKVYTNHKHGAEIGTTHLQPIRRVEVPVQELESKGCHVG